MNRIHGLILGAAMFGLAGSQAWADLVFLKNGRVLEGNVRRENGKVYITQPNGVIIISADKVDHIEEKETSLDVYYAKAKAIDIKAPGAADSFAKLGQWCNDKGMESQAGECFLKAINLDPANEAGHVGLGHVKFDGKWMQPDEANKAKGLVKHDDAWVTQEAKQDLVRINAQKELQEKSVELEKLKIELARAEAEKAQAEADRARAQNENDRVRRNSYIVVDPYLQGYAPAPPVRVTPNPPVTYSKDANGNTQKYIGGSVPNTIYTPNGPVTVPPSNRPWDGQPTVTVHPPATVTPVVPEK